MAKLTRNGKTLFNKFLGEFNDLYVAIENLERHKDKAVQKEATTIKKCFKAITEEPE